MEEYEEERKHGSYHGREYHCNRQQNLNYLDPERGGGGELGSQGGACGEVLGGSYRGEEYKNGEPAYNGFENLEGEYDQSNFEDNADLEDCLYQEKEEKVTMMVFLAMMVMTMTVSKFNELTLS